MYLNDLLASRAKIRLSKITAFHHSMIRQSIYDIKPVGFTGMKHKILMFLSSNYQFVIKENIRLSNVLSEKERKLADSDAQVSELAKANTSLQKTARKRKLILKENNLDY